MGMLKKIFISIIITIVNGCAAYQSKTVNNVTTAITDQGIQYKSAENSDQKMINYDDSADALFTDARSLQRQRQFKPAIKKYEEALSKYQPLAKTNPDKNFV
jgi:tetratricopeptide (TPR) repeat protein